MQRHRKWITRILSGVLAGGLALLTGCGAPAPVVEPVPSPIAGVGTGRFSETGTTGTGTATSGTSTTGTRTTTSPTTSTTAPTPVGNEGTGMSDEEWKEYTSEDPQYQKNQDKEDNREPESKPSNVLPPDIPPPTSNTTTATTTAATTVKTTSTTVSTVPSSSQTGSAGTTTTTTTTTKPTTTTTTKPSPPQNGWYVWDGKTYYYKNGKPLTGYQDLGDTRNGGLRYYFDANGVLSSKAGIDVSTYQGIIDWNKVKAAGIDFAMIRVGFRGYGSGSLNEDVQFERNIKGAHAAGVKVGLYFFTQAITVEEGRAEAQFVLDRVKKLGIPVTYPIAFDTENIVDPTARANNLSAKLRTDIALAFCQTIEAAGYDAMVYSYRSWLLYNLDLSRLTKYDTWMAHVAATTDFAKPYTMWQYENQAKVNGISGDVDLNLSFVDYAAR